MKQHVLIIGSSGLTGGAIAQHLSDDPDWTVTTVSRRPAKSYSNETQHVRVDLLDKTAVAAAFAELSEVTHVVYAGYLEGSSMAQSVAPNVAMLANTLDSLNNVGARLNG